MHKYLISIAVSAMTFGVSAATSISKEEVSHFKLTHVGSINVGPSNAQVSSPSDLHGELSKLAEKKGGKYYVITAASERGPNFVATAEVYK